MEIVMAANSVSLQPPACVAKEVLVTQLCCEIMDVPRLTVAGVFQRQVSLGKKKALEAIAKMVLFSS